MQEREKNPSEICRDGSEARANGRTVGANPETPQGRRSLQRGTADGAASTPAQASCPWISTLRLRHPRDEDQKASRDVLDYLGMPERDRALHDNEALPTIRALQGEKL
jgi:hypothetical protein